MSVSSPRLTLHRLDQGITSVAGLFDQATEGLWSLHNPQLKIVCDYLVAKGVAAAVWQRNVQDPDFLAEHAAYYSKWSFKVPRFCHRLHFFAMEPRSADVIDALAGWSESADAYLGFVTLRPVTQCPVGATFLKRPHVAEKLYIHAYDRFPVHLAGYRFDVEATPFMQQDNAVGACAQAAVWMGLRTLRWREGRSALNPAQITSTATRYVVNGRTLPNRQGLRLDQITEVVRFAGYSPHLIELRSPVAIEKEPFSSENEAEVYRQLYPYVESGIPIILALLAPGGGHAVLIIGHQWCGEPLPLEPKCFAKNHQGIEFVDASAWARPFVIHNDNSGPYLPLPSQSVAHGYALQQAAWAIPLLSADILVDAEEAQTACLHLATRCFGQELFQWPSRVVIRTRLMMRSRFREEIRQTSETDALKRYYQTKWLPAYVWLTELYDAHGYADAPFDGARKLAEVLLEPNADPKDGHFLTAVAQTNLLPPGLTSPLVWDREPFGGEVQVFLVR